MLRVEFMSTATESLRPKNNIARFGNELLRSGIVLILVAAGLGQEFALLTISMGAGLFALGGANGFPECDRLCSGTGSRKEHDLGRVMICGLAIGLSTIEETSRIEVFAMSMHKGRPAAIIGLRRCWQISNWSSRKNIRGLEAIYGRQRRWAWKK
jgi:hypothetical protein